MQIKSAVFIKGIVGEDEIFEDKLPQIVFIGRSNVGKSSVINSFVNKKHLARTSSTPGRTQQINIFLINKAFYLVDIPGYGFAKLSKETKQKIHQLINWYLFNSDLIFQKVVLIIDANIGPTVDDLEIFQSLINDHKDVLIVANKIDKIKPSDYDQQLQKIQASFSQHKIIPYSAEKKIGIEELTSAMFS